MTEGKERKRSNKSGYAELEKDSRSIQNGIFDYFRNLIIVLGLVF